MNRLFDEYRSTTNSYVYNKVRKGLLERHGEIRCSWCAYHRGENDKRKWYGNYGFEESTTTYPNWKLVSKSKKQWMKKPLKKKWKEGWNGRKYFEFKW